jgi:hypothetical protein
MHYSINPQEIKTNIEKLWNTVKNVWNIKQYRTKLPLKPYFRMPQITGNHMHITDRCAPRKRADGAENLILQAL